MIYQVTLTYQDDKTVDLLMTKEVLDCFFKDIKESNLHYNELTGVGFWTSLDSLRHIIVQPNKEGLDCGIRETDNESSRDIPSGDEPSV